jgi:hypothetical protein
VRERLQLAVDFIVDNQNEEGGWRYVPKAVESDMSVTVCQLNALRGAPQRGHPRAARHDRRRAPLRRPQLRARRGGRARRLRLLRELLPPGQGQLPLPGAAPDAQQLRAHRRGIAALHNAGEYGRELKAEGSTPGETLDLQASVDFLLDHVDLVSGRSPYTFHYFYWYGHYYATQALYEVGGQAWTSYYPRIRDEIVGGQLPDGSLPCRAGPGPAFSTAVAAIILSLPYGYLPIFQR